MDESEKPIRRVLIVDDEPGVRESLRILLKDTHEPVAVGSAPEALSQLACAPFDLVLLDIVMPGIDGLQLLEAIRGQYPTLPVVMLTATRTVKTAVDAMKLGAFDYLTKPFDVDELRLVLDKATENAALVREVEALRTEVGRRYQLDNVIGHSPGMQEAFKTVLTVAPRKSTVLITGESGTGKELIAKAIHYGSPRARKPLVTLNCSAIPESLLESELFGHERGSFTDAHAKKLGQFELAHESTLFLDEIGEMGAATQAKLLRVLETGQFLRVGGERPLRVDVRIIAATNRDLAAAMQDGSFRSDLFYRLNVVAVHLPPLRERREDLVPLIRHFVEAKSRQMGIAEKPIRPDAVDALLRYGWPGNVRELENLIERALVLSEGSAVTLEDLPATLRHHNGSTPGSVREDVLGGRKSIGVAVDEFERDLIEEALRQTDFNQTRAAERLGTTRRILKYRMDKLGIDAPAAVRNGGSERNGTSRLHLDR
ncbi:MAG TPA: sigma-54 dependent transcriptional regulator [Candidatus Binatia bacterium]|nr:sigma-54 dependent transcriptional regulator [Candidatus Binatia bacterium]